MEAGGDEWDWRGLGSPGEWAAFQIGCGWVLGCLRKRVALGSSGLGVGQELWWTLVNRLCGVDTMVGRVN